MRATNMSVERSRKSTNCPTIVRYTPRDLPGAIWGPYSTEFVHITDIRDRMRYFIISGSPPTPFDAQTALITNMFDPHDTCNVCMTGQGVREDHSDPVRAIHLTKWLVKASYTDENEEISLVKKKTDL